MKKAVLIHCMDARHDGRLTDAIRAAAGVDYRFYSLTGPGGAGILSSVFPEQIQDVITNTEIALSLGAEEIFLAIHGSSEQDPHGCGGYIHSGCASEYETPERSREFSHNELRSAARRLRNKHIEAPVRLFYITFDENGENLVEEVSLKEAQASAA